MEISRAEPEAKLQCGTFAVYGTGKERTLFLNRNGVKYKAKDFYEWHHKLTGSCEMGRNTFAEEHGIDLNSDMFTVEEFVELCKTSYGGEIIRKLNEDGENE